MNNHQYVHGYTNTEANRLRDQANTLSELLHHDSTFPAGSRILEAGCGTGSQTIFLAEKNPQSTIVSVDISQESLNIAKEKINKAGHTNVTFQQADLREMPFDDQSFDHIFICFVLEHLPNPQEILNALQRVLKKGGSITVIEGDHGSAFFYPQSKYAQAVIQCQIDLQAACNGNALIGRELYPLLSNSGYNDCVVSPRMVYADASRPELVDGFTCKTFTAMIEGVQTESLSKNLITKEDWDKGITDLYKTAKKDGVFCYTFFKATAYL